MFRILNSFIKLKNYKKKWQEGKNKTVNKYTIGLLLGLFCYKPKNTT